jgi:hypothetical protein
MRKQSTYARKRQRYQADPAAIYNVMNRIQLFTPEETVRLSTPPKLAYEKLRTGIATEPDFHVLAAAINVTMVLAEKIDPLAEQSAIAARDAMLRCWARFQRTGRLGFDGLALQDIPIAIDLHDQLVAMLTPLQIGEGVKVVQKRKANGDVAELATLQ